MDPLGADATMARLPMMNEKLDCAAIAKAIERLLPPPVIVERFALEESLAAMRDLGMLSASLKRHSVEPCTAVPGLEPILLALGARADMPPRDTLLHYTSWNPEGTRCRRYTTHADEAHLLDCVRRAAPAIDRAIAALVDAQGLPPGDECAARCREAAAHLECVVDATVHAMRHVSPAVFARELRLYYEPYRVGGRELFGAGAVELPLFIVDQIAWAGRAAPDVYREFQPRYVPYCVPRLRALFARVGDAESLVERLLRLRRESRAFELDATAAAVLDVLHVLVRFRGPHARLAQRAYSARVGAAISHPSG